MKFTRVNAAQARERKGIFSAIKNANGELEIMLYDEIGYDFWSGGGITAKDVADQLKAAGTLSRIVLRINSPGGDVFEGSAIYSQLASSGVPVDVMIDGLAASAASFIAMVGRSVSMGDNAMMMIHNPWSIEMGDANDMRKCADTLDKVRDSMLPAYMRRYSGTQDELIALLDAETWLTAEDCKQAGLADEITTPDTATQARVKSVAAKFDLSAFKNAPESLKKPKAESNDTDGAITHVESEPTTPSENGTDCACPCASCQNSNCAGCTTADCNYDNCDCPAKNAKLPATNAAAETEAIAMEHEHKKRWLRLAEIS
jgi:ATP-dependent protease ClpP protease subunit